VEFGVADGKILFGRSAIKGCTDVAPRAIVDARRTGEPFHNIFDFCERVDPAVCSRSKIEILIKAGALDSMGVRRAQLLAVLERAVQSGSAIAADRRSGQKSLFDSLTEDEPTDRTEVPLPDVPELDQREMVLMEKEVLGFYLSSHPLADYRATLSTYCSHTTATVSQIRDRAEVTLGGMLSSIKHSRTRRGGKYVNFDLEDMDGSIRCILWPEAFQRLEQLVQPEAILLVQGTIDRRGGDEANLIAGDLIPLEELASRYTRGVMVKISEEAHGEEVLPKLHEILRGYPGDCQLKLYMVLSDGTGVHLTSQRIRVDVNAQMRSRVDELLGPGHFKLLTASPQPNRTRYNEPRRAPAQVS